MNRKIVRALLTAVLGISALICSANADCIGGAVTTADVNLRSGAGTDTAILDTLPSGTAVVVESDTGSGWYKVNFSGVSGYMSAEYLDFSAELALSAAGSVSATDVNLRSGPGTDTAIVRVTSLGEKLEILGVSGNWYRVSAGGDIGYMRGDYVALSPSAASGETPAASDGSIGAQIVAFARQLLGTPYVWAAETPEEGFDCSGFVSYCFKSFGYSTNRTAATLFENGVAVGRSELLPGDAVFFCSDSSSSIGHVGLYIGDGEMIHASSSAGEVIITNIEDSGYYTRNYVGARRIAE